jgi:hypothetical protein
MQVSAEIRWFWRDAPPAGLQDWFRDGGGEFCAAGGGQTRVDEYLLDTGQAELGIKRRGGKPGVEVKGLVTEGWADLDVAPFVGAIELWCKWTSEPLQLPARQTVATEKRRWLRKFDGAASGLREMALDPRESPLDDRPLPALGCNVELTRVALPSGTIWWTLGFEAFGPVRTLERDLRGAAAALAARRPPLFAQGLLASYPAWLREHAQEG